MVSTIGERRLLASNKGYIIEIAPGQVWYSGVEETITQLSSLMLSRWRQGRWSASQPPTWIIVKTGEIPGLHSSATSSSGAEGVDAIGRRVRGSG